MRIFGVSIVTIIVLVAVYWLGTKNAVGNVLSSIAGG